MAATLQCPCTQHLFCDRDVTVISRFTTGHSISTVVARSFDDRYVPDTVATKDRRRALSGQEMLYMERRPPSFQLRVASSSPDRLASSTWNRAQPVKASVGAYLPDRVCLIISNSRALS